MFSGTSRQHFALGGSDPDRVKEDFSSRSDRSSALPCKLMATSLDVGAKLGVPDVPKACPCEAYWQEPGGLGELFVRRIVCEENYL